MMKLSLNTLRLIKVAGLLSICLCFFIGGCNTNNSKQKNNVVTLDSLPSSFKKALLSMYDNQQQMGIDSIMYKLDESTQITAEQGMCIFNLCRKFKPKKTLEIGMAYGYSTIYFLAAIKANKMGHHIAMDPFETAYWHGIGLQKIHELGMDSSFSIKPDYDIYAIPDLAREKCKFDVIFIDGNHRFDDVLLDFTLSDYVCADHGYIILHDLWMPSIKRVAKFIVNNRPDYELQEDLQGPQMMVFKKITVDSRPWNHYISF